VNKPSGVIRLMELGSPFAKYRKPMEPTRGVRYTRAIMNLFAQRRQAVYDAITPGIAVFPTAAVALRNNDVEHDYRQDSDFYYLTGLDEPDCVLVLVATKKRRQSLLFVRPRDAKKERWDGIRSGVEGATRQFGIDKARAIEQLPTQLPQLLGGAERLFYRLGVRSDLDHLMITTLTSMRGKGRRGVQAPTHLIDPATIVHELRLHKSAHEQKLMRDAAVISRDAHVQAMRFTAPGKYEYEVEGVLRQQFLQGGSERVAYAPIVGGGANATVLHYRSNRDRLEDGSLLLIDAGCEYHYYASDITRTFPVNGKFSRPQRALYEVVLEAQLAAIEKAVAGATFTDLQEVAVAVLVQGLLRLRLLRGTKEKIIANKEYRKFYMHGIGHYLGMDVHDVGSYRTKKKPRPFEPGTVITVEPGLYIDAHDRSVPKAYRGLGIRIEDDILITRKAPLVLTHDIPKTVKDVEKACAG